MRPRSRRRRSAREPAALRPCTRARTAVITGAHQRRTAQVQQHTFCAWAATLACNRHTGTPEPIGHELLLNRSNHRCLPIRTPAPLWPLPPLKIRDPTGSTSLSMHIPPLKLPGLWPRRNRRRGLRGCVLPPQPPRFFGRCLDSWFAFASRPLVYACLQHACLAAVLSRNHNSPPFPCYQPP